MWQVLGKEDTFPVFCVVIMVSGVLSYLLAVYQIFLGLKEDKVVTGSGQEAGLEMESITMAHEDIASGLGGLGQCSTSNATVWPEMESERQKKARREHQDSPMEVGSDPAEGSKVKIVSGKVMSGCRQQAGSQLKVESEIPHFFPENSENKDLYAENKLIRKKGKVIYPGYSTRGISPTAAGPKEARREEEASPEEAGSRKSPVSKNIQPTGETWQLRGQKWVEIKANKNP